MSGDTEHFLERAAKIQFGLMICAFCEPCAGAADSRHSRFAGRNAAVAALPCSGGQMSDVLQYVWESRGKHKIAASVSPNKTWEGFLGGVATATLLGAALWGRHRFTPLQAAGMSLVITVPVRGGLVMSAIKRDAGLRNFGAVIEGHGGILDRIDSLCFARRFSFTWCVFLYAVRPVG